MRLILFVSIFMWMGQICIANDGLSDIITPEGIGKHLAELLIKRGDIEKSAVALRIDSLYPDEGILEDESEIGIRITSKLTELQEILPLSWDNLLYQADEMGVSENATYLKTYFIQIHKRQFMLTSIFTSGNKYYTFSAYILFGKDHEGHVTRVYDYLDEYESLEELEDEFYSVTETYINSDSPSDEFISKLQEKRYKHSPYMSKVPEGVHLPSSINFTNNIKNAITQLRDFNSNVFFLSKREFNSFFDTMIMDAAHATEADEPNLNMNTRMEYVYSKYVVEEWENTISTLATGEEKFEVKSIEVKDRSNIPFWDYQYYNAVVSCEIVKGNTTYILTLVAVMVNNVWKVAFVNPLQEY